MKENILVGNERHQDVKAEFLNQNAFENRQCTTKQIK